MSYDNYNRILDKLTERFKKWEKIRKNRSIEELITDANEWDAEAFRIWNMNETKVNQQDNKTSTARLECLLFVENYSRIITKELAQRQTEQLIKIEISKIRKSNTEKKRKTKKKITKSSKRSSKSQ